MSAWRRVALESLPEFKDLINRSEEPMSLWVELSLLFEKAYEEHNDDLIRRLYEYAEWCLHSPGKGDYFSAAGTAAAYAFYEHIPLFKAARDDLHRWLTRGQFLALEGAFRYHLADREFVEFRDRFLANRDQFLVRISKKMKHAE